MFEMTAKARAVSLVCSKGRKRGYTEAMGEAHNAMDKHVMAYWLTVAAEIDAMAGA